MAKRDQPRLPTTATDVSASGESPRYLLVMAQGGVRIHKLPSSGTVTIGRDAACEVILDFPSISREHTRITLGPTSTITDLGSRNGTTLRGRKIAPNEEQTIGAGESIALGPVSLLLLPPGASAPIAVAGRSMLSIEDPLDSDGGGLLPAIAQAPASVLIVGETGVGKEVLSSRIHELSGRAGPYVAINCAALTETLLESELFGHEKGAFTGATQAKQGLLQSAAGGTLLLDEIGEMSPSVQAKLLRAIETQSILRIGGVREVPIDVRFVAATHRDLVSTQSGFRSDLYHRLAGFVLTIPPLRQRRQHLMKIAAAILAQAAAKTGARAPAVDAAATVALMSHAWPGNVRELRNVMTRAMVLARGGEIGAEHILFDAPVAPTTAPPEDDDGGDDERARIVRALDACVGNQTRAAEMLGISRTTLVQKLKLFDIPRPRSRR